MNLGILYFLTCRHFNLGHYKLTFIILSFNESNFGDYFSRDCVLPLRNETTVRDLFGCLFISRSVISPSNIVFLLLNHIGLLSDCTYTEILTLYFFAIPLRSAFTLLVCGFSLWRSTSTKPPNLIMIFFFLFHFFSKWLSSSVHFCRCIFYLPVQKEWNLLYGSTISLLAFPSTFVCRI